MKPDLKKYHISGPRYTSYPTVPYWENIPGEKAWKDEVRTSFGQTNDKKGISLYIHLPFCESLCTYCGCNTRITTNHLVETPYIMALLREWALYLEVFEETPRIRELHLGGGTPTFFSSGHLGELIDGIFSTSIVCRDAELSFEAHPNNTTAAHLAVLAEKGFKRISLGIQDFDPVVQEAVNRIQPFGTVKKITEEARSYGYTSINYDLIYGLPFQRIQSIQDTVAKVSELRPERIAFYSYAHIPWIKPGQRKFTEKDLAEGDEKRALYETGRELLEKAGYVEIGMDHFALKTDPLYKAMQDKKLHRNFMGYTCTNTELLIGLGVSAIGDTWYAYAQNEKKVEDYYAKVNSGKLPIFRGHLLDEEDLVLREHILNIMCRFETSWLDPVQQCEALYEGLAQLKEMQDDGLVSIYPYKLVVNPEGKPFLRNVCMAFDARLKRKVPGTQIFSKVI